MKAMVLRKITSLSRDHAPLTLQEISRPEPDDDEVLVSISACAVCHTELDEIEGRTPPPSLPVIPGHQIVGRVVKLGHNSRGLTVGDRVGVAWIFSACGTCAYCRSDRENLCPEFRATGRDVDGGYAEAMVAKAAFVHRIPNGVSDLEAAPFLCAGAIGYRSIRLAEMRDGDVLGLTGFGASGHLVLKMVKQQYPRSSVFVFTRSKSEQEFARDLGAAWAGEIDAHPPELLHAIIDTTPAWHPVVASLEHLRAGGRLIINAIRKEEQDKQALASLNYPSHLWLEKEVKSVANVTRTDVREFLELATQMAIKPDIEVYSLEEANRALMDLRERKIRGAKVLRIASSV